MYDEHVAFKMCLGDTNVLLRFNFISLPSFSLLLYTF